MPRKTVPFTRKGIEKLPNDKPVDYQIRTDGGRLNYEGIAGRGNVHDRLRDHLPGGQDYVPGSKVTVRQHPSIAQARATESRSIATAKPRYNKQGK